MSSEEEQQKRGICHRVTERTEKGKRRGKMTIAETEKRRRAEDAERKTAERKWKAENSGSKIETRMAG